MSLQPNRALRAVLLALAFAALAQVAPAQDQALPDLFSADALANREQVGHSDSENIDPLTGVLTLAYTDVHLPGNGGFDLKVMRSYREDRAGPYVSNSVSRMSVSRPTYPNDCNNISALAATLTGPKLRLR
jgi:hypothetical protein